MWRDPFDMLLFFLFILLLGLVSAQPPDSNSVSGSASEPDSENPLGLTINVLIDNVDQVIVNPEPWNNFPLVPQGTGDPRGRLRCVGQFPEFAIPASYAQNPYRSLLDVCAKTSYGGLPFSNLGGYCGWFIPDPRPIFDLTTAASLWHSAVYRSARRMALYCMTKCSCALDLIPDVHLDFKILNYVQPQYMWQADFDNAIEQALPYRPPSSIQKMAMILYVQEDKVSNLFIQVNQVALTATNTNSLECLRARTPRHYLPVAARNTPYPDLVSLCSAIFLGGYVKGSAGGICIKRPEGIRREIMFLDEYTHPPFERRRETEPFSVVTMLWCHQHCWCKNSRDRRRQRPDKTVPWLFDATVNFRNGGCTWTPAAPVPNSVANSEYVLIPGKKKGQLGEPESNTCGAATNSESNQCANSWPADLPQPALPSIPDFTKTPVIFPLPESTPLVAFPYKLPSTPELAVCGTTCSSNKACFQQGGSGCRCVLTPNLATIKAAGLDPIASDARCFSSSLSRGSLLGRSLESSEKEMEDYGLLCACNSTYVSSGCCGSAEGLVWESGGSKGQLPMGFPENDEHGGENDSQNLSYFSHVS